MSGLSELEAVQATPEHTRLGWLQRAITVALEWAATLIVFALAILIFANAMGRYFFASPLPWTEEVAINLMVWMVGVGIVMAGMRQSLICCNILTDRLTGRRARITTFACSVLGAAVMAYVSWQIWRYIGMFGTDLSPILQIPKFVGMSGLFFATAGLSATLVISLLWR